MLQKAKRQRMSRIQIERAPAAITINNRNMSQTHRMDAEPLNPVFRRTRVFVLA